jgi:hypothetical protein
MDKADRWRMDIRRAGVPRGRIAVAHVPSGVADGGMRPFPRGEYFSLLAGVKASFWLTLVLSKHERAGNT